MAGFHARALQPCGRWHPLLPFGLHFQQLPRGARCAGNDGSGQELPRGARSGNPAGAWARTASAFSRRPHLPSCSGPAKGGRPGEKGCLRSRGPGASFCRASARVSPASRFLPFPSCFDGPLLGMGGRLQQGASRAPVCCENSRHHERTFRSGSVRRTDGKPNSHHPRSIRQKPTSPRSAGHHTVFGQAIVHAF